MIYNHRQILLILSYYETESGGARGCMEQKLHTGLGVDRSILE
jgi:hypothetical protein